MREGGVGYPQAVHERVDRHVRSSGRCLRRRRRNAGMMRPPPVTFGELGGTRSKGLHQRGGDPLSNSVPFGKSERFSCPLLGPVVGPCSRRIWCSWGSILPPRLSAGGLRRAGQQRWLALTAPQPSRLVLTPRRPSVEVQDRRGRSDTAVSRA